MKIGEFFEVIEFLGIEPERSIRLIKGNDLEKSYSLAHSINEYALYGFETRSIEIEKVLDLVKTDYNGEYQFWLVKKGERGWKKEKISLNNHDKITIESAHFFLFFKPQKTNSGFLGFKELISHLRSPEGCPWDRKQDHKSLRTNLIEETYEVIDAIDLGNPTALQEELGDLLLQVVLHAQIASEKNNFTIFDVIEGIHNKIVYRHPHVFQDWEVDGVKGVIHNWEILKAEEKANKDLISEKEDHSILESIPRNLPALSLAQKYQERAARVGFDWPEIEPVFNKVHEELGELRQAEGSDFIESELGDLLFAVVNLVRWYGFDAESILRQMSKRFLTRFQYIEKVTKNRGKKLTDLTLDEMNQLWEASKELETKSAQTGQ